MKVQSNDILISKADEQQNEIIASSSEIRKTVVSNELKNSFIQNDNENNQNNYIECISEIFLKDIIKNKYFLYLTKEKMMHFCIFKQ